METNNVIKPNCVYCEINVKSLFLKRKILPNKLKQPILERQCFRTSEEKFNLKTKS